MFLDGPVGLGPGGQAGVAGGLDKEVAARHVLISACRDVVLALVRMFRGRPSELAG